MKAIKILYWRQLKSHGKNNYKSHIVKAVTCLLYCNQPTKLSNVAHSGGNQALIVETIKISCNRNDKDSIAEDLIEWYSNSRKSVEGSKILKKNDSRQV